MRALPVRRTLPLRAWAALSVAALGLGILLSPIFTPTDGGTVTDDSEAEPVAFVGEASTVADTSRTDGATALEVLATLPVKGRAARPATTAACSASAGSTSIATAATPGTTSCSVT